MKSKINVGVIFTDKISSGGGFQQSINAALKFSNINLITINSEFKRTQLYHPYFSKTI